MPGRIIIEDVFLAEGGDRTPLRTIEDFLHLREYADRCISLLSGGGVAFRQDLANTYQSGNTPLRTTDYPNGRGEHITVADTLQSTDSRLSKIAIRDQIDAILEAGTNPRVPGTPEFPNRGIDYVANALKSLGAWQKDERYVSHDELCLKMLQNGWGTDSPTAKKAVDNVQSIVRSAYNRRYVHNQHGAVALIEIPAMPGQQERHTQSVQTVQNVSARNPIQARANSHNRTMAEIQAILDSGSRRRPPNGKPEVGKMVIDFIEHALYALGATSERRGSASIPDIALELLTHQDWGTSTKTASVLVTHLKNVVRAPQHADRVKFANGKLVLLTANPRYSRPDSSGLGLDFDPGDGLAVSPDEVSPHGDEQDEASPYDDAQDEVEAMTT